MKRNLIKGIVLISAIALSSCSSTNKLAGIKNAVNDDDVYYTKAKAGDAVSDMTYASEQTSNSNYNGDDDYYYYGDYASRLSRFSSYSPFDYEDNFYYAYVPYNNGFGAGLDYDRDYYANYYGFGASTNAYAPVDNGIYSPYNYGYSPYDMGYDDYNYGDAYSAYILGGYGGGGGGYGGLVNKHNTATTVPNIGTNPLARGIRTTPSAGVTRITSMPGRPSISVNTTTGVVTRNLNLSGNNNNNTASRQTRESYTPQQQSVAPRQTISTAPSSSSSAVSSSSSTSSGGGGRPVRP